MRLVDASLNRRVPNNGTVFVDDPLLIDITAMTKGLNSLELKFGLICNCYISLQIVLPFVSQTAQ